MTERKESNAERDYENIVNHYEKCCNASFYTGSKIDEGSIVIMFGSLLRRIKDLEKKIEELQDNIPAENYY